MAFPNCFLSREYFTESSRLARARPRQLAEITSLSEFNPERRTFTPWLTVPMRFLRGTGQSSKTNSPVGEPCQPSFSNFLPQEQPGTPFSTTKAVTPLPLDLGSVVAYTRKRSPTGPLVMKVLVPLRTKK